MLVVWQGQFQILSSERPSISCKQSDIVATGGVDTCGKFVLGVVDTGGNLPPASLTPMANLLPVSLTQVANLPPVSTTPAELVAKFVIQVENLRLCR